MISNKYSNTKNYPYYPCILNNFLRLHHLTLKKQKQKKTKTKQTNKDNNKNKQKQIDK